MSRQCIGLAGAIFLLAAPSAGQGQVRARSFEATGYAGLPFFNSAGGEIGGRSVDDLSSSLIDFAIGGSFGYNITPEWGVEGEFTGVIGIEQDIDVDTDGDGIFDVERNSDTPNFLMYNGNVVYHIPLEGRVVPYGTFGVGAITTLEDQELGIPESQTDFAINYGGGVKVFLDERWAVRGDFRVFTAFPDEEGGVDPDPIFSERVYGGVSIHF